MAVYDKEKEVNHWDPTSGRPAKSPDSLLSAEKQGGGSQNSTAADNEERSSVADNLYQPTSSGGRLNRLFKGGLNIKSILKNRRKAAVVGAVASLVGGGSVFGIFALFSFMNVFQLDHLLSNIDAKAFVRYQVDLDGSSKHWVQAYMRARLAEMATSRDGDALSEIPDSNKNLLFRANKVDTGHPFRDWYNSMRTSKFEKDLFEKQGIKFVSASFYDPSIKGYRTRPAVVQINGQPDLQFNSGLTDSDLKNLNAGKLDDFNKGLSKFIDTEVFGSDKEARKALRKAVNENTKWYQVAKRFYLRKSISNMTGIKSWKFFEKTREKISDKRVSIRNKLILKIFKDNTSSGRIVQCVFAVSDCSRMNTDPANPDNNANAAKPGGPDCDKNPEKCDTKQTEKDGDKTVSKKNDGELVRGMDETLTEEGVDLAEKEILEESADAGGGKVEKLVSAFISKEIMKKFNIATSIISVVDTLNKINESVKNESLVKLVYMARATQAIAIYSNLSIMRDQIKSGEIGSTQDVNDAMEIVAGGGNSAGFDAATDRNTSRAFAEQSKLSEATEKTEYCGADHQAAIEKPENTSIAKSEYHWVCDDKRIGSTTMAKMIQDGWKNSIGFLVDPILSVYNASGFGKIVSWVGQQFDGFMEATGMQEAMAGFIKGALKTFGLEDDFNGLVTMVTDKVVAFVGAGPPVKENSPGGQYVNQAAMGAAASAEFAARGNGAPRTTDESKQRAKQDVVAYLSEQSGDLSIYDKFASLDRQDSMLSKTFFAISSSGVRPTFSSTLSSLFTGSIFTRAHADDSDPYALSSLAGVESYDYPTVCKDMDPLSMTPQNATNADELGVIDPNALNWDMVKNAETFNQEMYKSSKSEEIKKQVYNCALLDSVASGSLGAVYNSSTLGGNAYGQ